jgi:hypothetical protein
MTQDIDKLIDKYQTAVINCCFDTFDHPLTKEVKNSKKLARSALRAAFAELEEEVRKEHEGHRHVLQIIERERLEIMNDPRDPSWTEHLANVHEAIRILYRSFSAPESDPK